ncbi:MerR family DNA-binding protein [Acidithiobacillus ferriphilus]|nr:MerR family DNA-binding protein [Acidithiobacillus ferriphilus]
MNKQRDRSGFSIGQVAKAAGVNVETVRFYERENLIKQPAKPTIGMRQYASEVVMRIRFIKHAQALGFTLQETRELLALRADDAEVCAAMRYHAEVKLHSVQEKIRSLQGLETVLVNLIKECKSGDARQRHSCPILQALDEEEIPGE